MTKDIIVVTNDILIYSDASGSTSVEVLLIDESLWLTQKRMAELFGVEVNTINYHIKEIINSGELDAKAVIRKFRITADDGKQYLTNVYNLDMAIAVGYRVNSYQATRFRIWATKVIKEYIIKGFALDIKRLKNGDRVSKDYFQDLLEIIRDIRASERKFYQKITDIYAQCSTDYDPNSPITIEFYATVQNKLHWAITGETAAEIIRKRADSQKTNMGLTNWKHSPQGRILKTDVAIAKNYLNEKELRELNRIVTMYLDFAEVQAERQIPMKMQDWIERLDAFLNVNQYDVLNHAGKISAEDAKIIAENEYQKFRPIQDRLLNSDFDQMQMKVNALAKETIKSDSNPLRKRSRKRET